MRTKKQKAITTLSKFLKYLFKVIFCDFYDIFMVPTVLIQCKKLIYNFVPMVKNFKNSNF